jgi:hypothetical protein
MQNNTLTFQQNKHLHLLLNKLNVDAENKAVLVYEYTQGRAESSKELTFHEARRLIHDLDQEVKKLNQLQPENRMRKKIFYYFNKCGYTKNDQTDVPRVNDWILKYGYLHKPLMDYTAKELPKLVGQAEKVYWTYVKSL